MHTKPGDRCRPRCRIFFFAPRYGGYWIPARAELLDQIWPDADRFSSAGGISVPRIPGLPRQLPIESDAPEHRFLRQPINLALSPKALKSLGDRARSIAISLIDDLQPKGHCEFVKDFSQQLPISVFMSMVDLPGEDREYLLARAEITTRSGDEKLKAVAYGEVMTYLAGWLKQRIEKPGDDLLTQILNIKIDGRPITFEEALSESSLVLFGGLDTVAGTMAFCARYLATDPEQRRELVEHPELIPQAVEELIRRHSIPTVARQLTEDVTLEGVTMKAGDYVMLVTYLHSLDDRAWQEPLAVDFHRKTDQMMSFGRGPHRCPGANLARTELRIFLEEWLKRIPDFEIDPARHSPTSVGSVLGVRELPLIWKT